MYQTVAHKTEAQFSHLLLLLNIQKGCLQTLAHKKEMASTAIRFITFVSALMLLLHFTYAAAPPIFQQRQSAKTWCVANPSANEAALRANMDFACSESDCSAIQGTGGCSVRYGGVLLSRASVAMNAYYQAKGRNTWNCFFNGTGLISITDPSLGTCKYA